MTIDTNKIRCSECSEYSIDCTCENEDIIISGKNIIVSEFDDSFISEVHNYIKTCKRKQEILDDNALPMKGDVCFPSVAGFAVYIGTTLPFLFAWTLESINFKEAMDYLKTVQEELLVNHSLSGRYNTKISGLILSSQHNFVPKTENTTKTLTHTEIISSVVNEAENADNNVIDNKKSLRIDSL